MHLISNFTFFSIDLKDQVYGATNEVGGSLKFAHGVTLVLAFFLMVGSNQKK